MNGRNDGSERDIRLRRGLHDIGRSIVVDDPDNAPTTLIEHLDAHPVRSVIIEVTTARTTVSLLCDGEAGADALPAGIVRDLARRGYLPATATRALVDANVIIAAGGPAPDSMDNPPIGP